MKCCCCSKGKNPAKNNGTYCDTACQNMMSYEMISNKTNIETTNNYTLSFMFTCFHACQTVKINEEKLKPQIKHDH